MGAALVSAALSYWYATTRFVPAIAHQNYGDSYDAFRYDWIARVLSGWPVHRILDEDIPTFRNPGYVRFLAIVYSTFTPDPLVGCFANWLLWLGAGLLLQDVAEGDRADSRNRAVFLTLWLLLPDAVDWTGTTSKEPLCACLLAVCLRLAVAAERGAFARAVLLAIVVGPTALFASEVRSALLLLAAVPFGVALEMRVRRSGVPWTFSAAVLMLVLGFVGLAGEGLSEIGHADFSATGYEHASETWSAGFARDSVLLRIGSRNKWLDLLAVPVRGLAHVVSPLNASPLALPLARVSTTSLLQWLSAGIYTLLGLAIALRVREARMRASSLPRRDRVLLYTSVMAVLILGLTGIVHERYRSILLPAYVPLGVRHLLDEADAHGARRILLCAAGFGVFATIGYVALKYVL
jgi:hypothetical protein